MNLQCVLTTFMRVWGTDKGIG